MNSSQAVQAAQASDTSWFDIFGLIVATMSVGITVILVMVAWHLSRNYLESIKEMQEIRKSSDEIAKQVLGLSNINSSILKESTLAIRTIFDLIMAMERRDEYHNIREKLLALHEWKNRRLSDEEVAEYDVRVVKELDGVRLTVTARMSDLYWLVGDSTERAAHLHALATTKGDYKSVDLLENIRKARSDVVERDELLVAISTLRQRLGRPSPTQRRRHNSSSWTGRP